MKIVCSANMPLAEEAFSTLGDTIVLPGRDIRPSDVRDADVLAIRSTTRVDSSLLAHSNVRFVGTATIGIDHMDIRYLEERGIEWCAAPGCNANSVSEYVACALLCLADRHSFGLAGKTLGVIGVGHVGGLVAEKAAALGMRTLRNDPPRERTEQEGRTPFVHIDRLLAESDIVTLHVPLTTAGPDATFHIADAGFFAKLQKGCSFLNTARGAATDTDALLAAIDQGIVAHTVVDTWEHESTYRADLLDRVDIGTPHIAGHSFEGKVAGTVMVYEQACSALGVDASWSVGSLLPPPEVPLLKIDDVAGTDEELLRKITKAVYDIERDDGSLREACCDDPRRRAAGFDDLRSHYGVRREFRNTSVALRDSSLALATKIAGLGFCLAP